MNKAAPASSDITKHEHKDEHNREAAAAARSAVSFHAHARLGICRGVSSISTNQRGMSGGADEQTVTYRRTAFEGIIHECFTSFAYGTAHAQHSE